MNTQVKPPVPYFAPLSRQAVRQRLEGHREAIAQQIWLHTSAISTLTTLMDDTNAIWEATQPDPAPEFAAMNRLARAS